MIIIILVFRVAQRQFFGFDQIEYQGQMYKLSKKYADWEDYSKSFNQLDTTEILKAEKALLSIMPKKSYENRKAFIEDLSKIAFPGYGSRYNGNVKNESGEIFILHEFTIPQGDKSRCLLYHVLDEDYNRFEFIADYVIANYEEDYKLQPQREVLIENDEIKYISGSKFYKSVKIGQESPKTINRTSR